MDWYSFGLLLYDNIELYLGILAISLVLYYFIFRTSYLSFLDPYIFNLLYSVFGFSVVIFLYATGSIQTRYLLSYLLTQAAFLGGLFVFKPLNKNSLVSNSLKIHIEEEGMLMKLLFFISSALMVIVQLVSYKLVGIPLLMESRIGAYADTGLGALGKLIDVLRPLTTFLLIYFLFKPQKSLVMRIYLGIFSIFLLLFFALSGSKSLFMSLGFILFIYLILNGEHLIKRFSQLRRYELYIILFGIVFAFFTIAIQQTSDIATDQSNVVVFLYRLVASGDAYYFSYPNGNIEIINGSKGFLALFGDIFSVVRIIPREKQPEILGLQLFQIYYDSYLIAGPNARHNVFGYVYYGFYGSIIFSFLIGFALSFVRNKWFFSLRKNVLGQICFMFLYLNLTFIETDPPVAIASLENVLLIFPFFMVVVFALYILLYDYKIRSRPGVQLNQSNA